MITGKINKSKSKNELMEKIKKRIEEIVSILKEIDEDDFAAQAGLSEKNIKKSEIELGISYPPDFRYFLSKMNGFSLDGEIVLPALVTEEGLIEESIPQVMKWERYEAANSMPEYFLPFSPNGRGDHYCFDLRRQDKNGIYPIIFWQWDYSYQCPDDDVEQVNDDFVGWIKEIIEDMKENDT